MLFCYFSLFELDLFHLCILLNFRVPVAIHFLFPFDLNLQLYPYIPSCTAFIACTAGLYLRNRPA